MSDTENKYIVLFEYDKPLDLKSLLNYESGVWFFIMTPGTVTVTDDNGNTGYYSYNNDVIYNVKSLRVDDENYSATESYNDMLLTNKSFFYDYDGSVKGKATAIYIHFDQWEPPLSKQVFAGGAVGYTWGNSAGYYYNDVYYEPRVSRIFPIKKNKDPLFFGVLKMQQGQVELINSDGSLDDWRDRNLFAQACRLMVGQYDSEYSEFEQKFTGNIEDDSRTWEDLKAKLADIRKGLTRSIADNLLTLDDYPDLNEDNVDKPKPIAYGKIYNAGCVCLNQEETASSYTFLMCDTEFNAVKSGSVTAYIEGEVTVPTSYDYANGTFTFSSAQLTVDGSVDSSQEITADFEVEINNGVSIIKDLITNYDGKPFISTFWDTTEVNTAYALSRDTSVYVDDDKKLEKVIKDVSSDIDGLFFAKDNGKYTVRIYDANRTPAKTIKEDEWTSTPDIDNNASEFLTSAVVEYRKDQANDTTRQYENLDYVNDTFQRYKRYKKATFSTGLTTEADAIDKSQTILDYSSNVQDIIKRATKWQNSDVEIMDFIICDPVTRLSGTPNNKVYEVVGVEKNYETMEVTLSMRYVKAYVPVVSEYYQITGEGSDLTDELGNTIIGGE